jgi:hypothetical protein
MVEIGEERQVMNNLDGKKLPTVEQVETIMAEYGRSSIKDFADRFGIEAVVVEATIDSLRRLRRISDEDSMPAIACYRDDTLDSIVRCAGSKHGYE